MWATLFIWIWPPPTPDPILTTEIEWGESPEQIPICLSTDVTYYQLVNIDLAISTWNERLGTEKFIADICYGIDPVWEGEHAPPWTIRVTFPKEVVLDGATKAALTSRITQREFKGTGPVPFLADIEITRGERYSQDIMMHEIGHVIIGHEHSEDPDNLMFPVIQDDMKLEEWQVKKAKVFLGLQ